MSDRVRLASTAAVAVAVSFAASGLALAGSGRLSTLSTVMCVVAVIYLAVAFVGAAALRADPGSATGWVFLTSGVAATVSTVLHSASGAALDLGRPAVAAWLLVVATPLAVAGVPLMATFGILLFPGRRLDTRGRRILGRVYAVELVLLLIWGTFSTNAIDIAGVVNPIAVPATDALVLFILIVGPLSLFACVSLWRYAVRDTGPHASALRACARVAFVVPVAYLACVVAGMTTGDVAAVAALELSAAVALGLAAWAGIVRHGLFDTRAVLSRTLVYGLLSVLLAGVYLLVAVGLGLIAGGLVPQVVAAVTAALAVLPLRDLAQRRINQWVYGLRDDPSAAFARLGDRLNAAGAPDDMLPAAARTVAEALRLPYVAIEAGGETLASYGRELPGGTEALDLPFASETIGQLRFQTRAEGGLSADEHRLLSGLTRQVAVAARAVLLTEALQGSRHRLVAAREEERRRLRRDLHDGLGPTLAGIALGIDTVRRGAPPGSATADLLGTLRQATEGAVDDIRRIVYDLRPPILDELGLAGAVREQAARLGAADIDVPDTMPALPAALEVAAYRIAVEALTNAARHAPGAPVAVRLALNGRLELTVTDRGTGLPDGYRAGVGLTSMRERAAELGGRCEVGRHTPHGTAVRAHFPFPEATP